MSCKVCGETPEPPGQKFLFTSSKLTSYGQRYSIGFVSYEALENLNPNQWPELFSYRARKEEMRKKNQETTIHVRELADGDGPGDRPERIDWATPLDPTGK